MIETKGNWNKETLPEGGKAQPNNKIETECGQTMPECGNNQMHNHTELETECGRAQHELIGGADSSNNNECGPPGTADLQGTLPGLTKSEENWLNKAMDELENECGTTRPTTTTAKHGKYPSCTVCEGPLSREENNLCETLLLEWGGAVAQAGVTTKTTVEGTARAATGATTEAVAAAWADFHNSKEIFFLKRKRKYHERN